MVRLFVPIPAEESPAELLLEGERFHYLVHVLRLELEATLEVFDGRGRSFDATVTAFEEGKARLSLTRERRGSAPRAIHLVQGLPKADKFEWILQKATELNASAFHPVSTERAIVKLSVDKAPERRRRWERIVEEAARQCGRSDVPRVEPVAPLLEACGALSATVRLLVLDEEERALPLSEAARAAGLEVPLALVIGPEGGLTREEVAALRALGATGVTLGRQVLRTETAGIAALCVLRHLEGLLG